MNLLLGFAAAGIYSFSPVVLAFGIEYRPKYSML
jgi:hypothetical protein